MLLRLPVTSREEVSKSKFSDKLLYRTCGLATSWPMANKVNIEWPWSVMSIHEAQLIKISFKMILLHFRQRNTMVDRLPNTNVR